MFRNIGYRDWKLHHILVTGMIEDRTGHQVFIPSRIARHIAAHYVGEDFYLWNHSSRKERKKMIENFYERNSNVGINPDNSVVRNPGDAFRVLRDVYSSWSDSQLGAAYKNIKKCSNNESTETCCNLEPISDSRGQYFLHLE